MAQKISEGRIIWPARKAGRPRHKKFASDLQSDFAGFSSYVECGNTNEGTEEMVKIMEREQFIFPKPRSLVENLLEQTTSENDIILDAFAGTGTTGHAVLSLNQRDGGGRRFILVELDANIAQSITAERLRRVIQGYTYRDQKGNKKFEPGLGGGFRYCELGSTLFDAAGTIRSEVSYQDLARHVFFTETGQPLPEDGAHPLPLLGVANGAAVYLLFNGVMKDASNTLTPHTLDSLPPFDGPKVIYGDGCLVGGERLRQLGVIFKQIPYQIRAG
jgi:site-specific DNA-methyltransferase (adenine-specific)/adenine-specific DNA-methyltransferase